MHYVSVQAFQYMINTTAKDDTDYKGLYIH